MWFVLFKIVVNSVGWRLPCRSGPPVDGPKDPRPRVLSLPRRFDGDPNKLTFWLSSRLNFVTKSDKILVTRVSVHGFEAENGLDHHDHCFN